MDFDTAKKFIDLVLTGEKGMSEYVNPTISPAVVLEFIGGEPFLAVDLMQQIVDYWFLQCIEMRHPWAERTMLSVCSNGVAYRDPAVQRFLARNAMRMSFSVTVDGFKELHDACRIFPDGRGSYDLAWDAASDWMARGGYMGSKVTVAPGNVHLLFEAIKHMVDAGYEEINCNCVYEEGWTIDHARTLYFQLKKIGQWIIDRGISLEDELFFAMFDEDRFHPKDVTDVQNWCGGNGVMIACDFDGRIYPCIRYMEMSLGGAQPPMLLGDVDNGILQCEEHRSCYECLKQVDRRTQSTDECFYCPIAEGCSWCTAYNYQVFGTPNARATYICVMHKAEALANAWFWPRYREAHLIDKPYTCYIPEQWALEIVDFEEWREIKDMCYETETEVDV